MEEEEEEEEEKPNVDSMHHKCRISSAS